MKNHLRIVFVFVSLAVAITAAHAADSPTSAVLQFCKADFEGVRTANDERRWESVSHVILWAVEPGWDTTSVVANYRVVTVSASGVRANVTVEYDVLGEVVGGVFENRRRKERVTFHLILGNEEIGWRNDEPVSVPASRRWRIKSPVIQPHESVACALQSARYWANKYPSDVERQHTLKQLEALAVSGQSHRN